MISKSSRYYDGALYQAKEVGTANTYNIVVDRKFPESQTVTYFEYTWKDGDSLSLLADRYLKDVRYWWKIMEINPEISDPMSLVPGQVIRVPNGR